MSDRNFRPILAAALVAAGLFASPAHATGLRLSGQWLMADDSSFDTFSSTDVRPGVDVSFSYSVFYLGKMFLVDVEGGYTHYTQHSDTLFDTYSTQILGHAMYLGLRVQFRHDRDYIEIIQPYARVDLGWSWTRAQIGSSGDLPAMHDWASGGYLYVGGGIQITVPTAFIRNRLRIKATDRFSIGFTYEFGYLRPQPLKMRFSQPTGAAGGPEPIPIEGLTGGSLDLAGMAHNFGFVMTF